MRIKKIEYDKELNWRLNPVDFSEQNLAVPVIILISSTTSGWTWINEI